MTSTTWSFKNSLGRVITTGSAIAATDMRANPNFTEIPGAAPGAPESKYEAQTVPQLRDEVERRNADRDPEGDAYLVVEAPGNKPELVAALERDDA